MTDSPENRIDPSMSDVGPAPRDWSMIVVMLAIVAALGFGGVAMMYRRAEASKQQAEVATALVQVERDRAEVALKEANLQRRAADQFRAQAQQAAASEAASRKLAEMAADTPRTETVKSDAAGQSGAQTSPMTPEPDRQIVGELDMRAVLDASARQLESGKLKDNPVAAGAVHSTLGHTYLSLGEYAKAAEHLRKAIELRQPKLGEKSAEVVKDRQSLDQAQAKLR